MEQELKMKKVIGFTANIIWVLILTGLWITLAIIADEEGSALMLCSFMITCWWIGTLRGIVDSYREIKKRMNPGEEKEKIK
jgi:hypothetical protein